MIDLVAAIRIEIFAPRLWQLLGGVLELRGAAFTAALSIQESELAALAIVLMAGLSEALGQSIVLFANRVKPARFIFSLFVDAVLFTFGYGFVVLSTWTVCRLPGAPHIAFGSLALVLAMSYAPMLFAFLGALPYLGSGFLNALRVWHFLAMVVGVAAAGGIDVFAAATYVWLGWLVMVLGQRSFGRPIVWLGTRILDAVAGVRLVEDAQVAIGRVEAGTGTSAAAQVAPARKASKHPRRWIAVAGLGGMALLAVIVALALQPVRQSVFGWQEHLPSILQLPLDLVWLGVIALVVAAFMAPLETLGWWAGWYGDQIDTSELRRPSKQSGAKNVTRYVVYLDGIAQSSSKYTPDIEAFLDALSPELPPNVALIRGVMCYSVLNKPLDDDPILSRFWKLVDASRSKHMNSLLGMLINMRNVTIVAVSADPRYGPMYNFGMADVIYRSLVENGYPKKSGVPVTLIGYSGGGQMACGSATFLKRALDAPVDVISLGGVISGNDAILDLEHLYHLVGKKDAIERIGPVMFASRWPIAVLSFWNRAKRLGTLTFVSLGPVGHQVPGGMLDPQATLPDGRSNLRQTLDYIESIVTDRFVAKNDLLKQPSNYDRYVAGVHVALDGKPASKNYLPAAQWAGRLILPRREERFGGVFFEVQLAPSERAGLVGKTVRVRWSDDPDVRARVRAVARDVNFSAEAQSASTFGGLIMPVRVNHWRLVDPLESLAGAHPIDDIVVKLDGNVTVREDRDGTATLFVDREPVQITGLYYGLLRFRGPASENGDGYRVVHFDRDARAFSGAEESVKMPAVVPDLNGVVNSVVNGIERSPLNADGWYVYGAFDRQGRFVVQSLAPRALLSADGSMTELADARGAYHFTRREAWRALTAVKGGVVRARMAPWKVGDVGLVVHTYGGIGGEKREKAASGPIYFGHFAYGIAEVVADQLSGEARFDIKYHQVYTQNGDGLIAGVLHWSRYMGDRQFGWAGVRPVCDAILKLDAFSGDFTLDGGRRASALEALERQLEAMTARYRIGDGTGGTFVGAANNCSQDSNQALFATLRALQGYVEAHSAFAQWVQGSPAEFARYEALTALANDLRKKLQLFGAPRRDWSDNEYNLGSTMEDAPLRNLVTALGSWRCVLPRLAFNTIVGTFLRHGAALTILGTDQIGGERSDIAPVAPTAL